MMAKRRAHRLTSPARPAGESLVDWRQPERNAHVLDWRERAHEFGLVPVDDHAALEEPVVEPAERLLEPAELLEEEEPEAFQERPLEDVERDEVESADIEEAPEARVPQEELDLVCVYLKDIGRRKLLKAHEEQEIGRTIEAARGDLLAELAVVPAARRTVLALADEVRRHTAPAAELILLPDGGELRPGRIDPILRALARVRRLDRQIDRRRQRLIDRRSTAASRANVRQQIERVNTAIASIMRDLPIRPSVVDDVVAELRRLDQELEAVERTAGGDRAE